MEIPTNLDQVEAWSGGVLTNGWHHVAITDAVEGRSTGGHDEMALQFRATELDAEPGGIMTDWLHATDAAAGRLKAFLTAIHPDGNWPPNALTPEALIGRQLVISVGPHRTPDGSTVSRVKGFQAAKRLAERVPEPVGSARDREPIAHDPGPAERPPDDDIPF